MTETKPLEDVVRSQLQNIVKRPHTANECTDAILTAAAAYAADEASAAETDLGALGEKLTALTAHWRDVAARTRGRTAANSSQAAYLKSAADGIDACADALAKVLEN
jgi:hypothetical protein